MCSRFEVIDHAIDLCAIKRAQHRTARIDALGYGEAALARRERHGLAQENIVLIEAAFIANGEHVAKAVGRDERDARSLALDDRVGRERRAVDDEVEFAGAQRGAREQVPGACNDGLFGRSGRRQELQGMVAPLDVRGRSP